jgi:hypothetical protein
VEGSCSHIASAIHRTVCSPLALIGGRATGCCDLDPGAAFGIGADNAGEATEAATNVDPLSFLGS